MTAETPTTDGTKRPGPRLSRPAHPQPAEPIDLLALAGPSVAARGCPAAAIAVIVAMALTPRASVRWAEAVVAAGLVAAVGRQAQDAARLGP